MANATCSEADCEEASRARGLCSSHYRRAWRAGELAPATPTLPRHCLSNVNSAERLADCSECGPQVRVRIRHRVRPDRRTTIDMQCYQKYQESRKVTGTRAGPRPDAAWRSRIKNKYGKYGMTPEGYDLLFVAQEGRCAICQDLFAGPRAAHVDHDHLTGTIRGLLCRGCNIALGLLRDNPESARQASAYLLVAT